MNTSDHKDGLLRQLTSSKVIHLAIAFAIVALALVLLLALSNQLGVKTDFIELLPKVLDSRP
jgi:hypothetical protein